MQIPVWLLAFEILDLDMAVGAGGSPAKGSRGKRYDPFSDRHTEETQ